MEIAGVSLRVDGDNVERENRRSLNGEVGSLKAEPSRSGVYFRLQHSNFNLPLGFHSKPRSCGGFLVLTDRLLETRFNLSRLFVLYDRRSGTIRNSIFTRPDFRTPVSVRARRIARILTSPTNGGVLDRENRDLNPRNTPLHSTCCFAVRVA